MATCSRTHAIEWCPPMISLIRVGLIWAVALLLSSCKWVTPQTEMVKNLLSFKSADQKALERYAWSFSVGGAQYRLYALKVEGRTVYFGNNAGMRLTWDGESVVALDNMPGAFGTYRSGRALDPQGREERWYAQEATPERRARCTPAATWRLSDDRYGWRQTCRGEVDGVSLTATHVVEYDSKAMIREIEASVFPGGPLFILRRLSP